MLTLAAAFFCTTFTTTLPCADDVLAWDGPAATVTWGESAYSGESPAPIGCYEGWVAVQAEGKAPVQYWWEADPGRLTAWNYPCDMTLDRPDDDSCLMADR